MSNSCRCTFGNHNDSISGSNTSNRSITLKNRKLNPVAERFIDHLKRYVAEESC